MKQFFKMVLAVICGLFIAGIICFILGIGFVSSLAPPAAPLRRSPSLA